MKYFLGLAILGLLFACSPSDMTDLQTESSAPFTIMSLDPGHFHAGLIHKSMYPELDSTIYVYAPQGPELTDYLNRIASYNQREESPTAWNIVLAEGSDYLEKMISEKPGNVMIVAGKNDLKIDYITAALGNGIHVYADKPLVIDSEGYKKLIQAFATAKENNVMLYDIMTERFEIASVLQRDLSMNAELFGELEIGSLENPAITKESIHHFFKYVSGQPLIRPDWFFDVSIEGHGIVDVTTHLVDLIQWEAFPGQILDTTGVEMLASKTWATSLDLEQFQRVTGKMAFPDFLQKAISDEKLEVLSNGEMNYTLNGKHAKVSVIWNYEAPEGTGDTHYSMMRGTKANLIIRQGKADNFKPTLYVKLLESQNARLENLINTELQQKYSGLALTELESGEYRVEIPEALHVGHESHFGQVTAQFLSYLKADQMPDWEIPNMLVKYYTITKALEKAMKK